ncbi:BTAD domain-containing putative transcriptional regulator [Massilia endophytica]|uniref:BTAD domain-containing putative transcriptional regulator n=1 Tax=Massilia endophytica TaxID=2899220 RepID=UPI001E33957F|nr:BTAD domain-containing putative transcriptional regulator [Massilia endophytica]UGQ47988.1 hypothetical protein LSQ66_05850 [Massilia endophytica]
MAAAFPFPRRILHQYRHGMVMKAQPHQGMQQAQSAAAPIRYAKLERPRVHDALPRERLFALLDEARPHSPVIWITSPPGAGKSTLAASYLAHAQPPSSVWYQVDQSDADPATFFFFLGAALQAGPQAIAWTSPAPDRDLRHAARLFFRDLYARMPAGSIMVLDNVQELACQADSQLLDILIGEVPAALTLLLLSREAPPLRMARLEIAGTMRTVGWEDLRLDQHEVRQIVQLKNDADPQQRAWLDLVDGWVAGVVLLKNLSKAGAAAPHLPSREAVFRYFAGEILERMPPAWQRLLLLLSCLPGVSAADAERLTGDAAAPKLLSQLYHNRLFVDRRGSAHQTYHFHALFREFLQLEAKQRLAPGERARLLERAADILDDQGRTDEAAQLYLEARSPDGLCRLLLRRAQFMLAAGRGQSWREWMSCLPADQADSEPWLLYWHGVSLHHVATRRGRDILLRAEEAFRLRGDRPAQLQAVAAIIDSYDLEWGEVGSLAHWIDALAEGLASLPPDALDAPVALRLHSRLLLAVLIAAPNSALLTEAASNTLRLVHQVSDPTELLAAGSILLRYHDWADDGDTAQRLVAELGQIAADDAVSPFHRLWWYSNVTRWHNKDGNYREARETTGAVKRIVGNLNLDPLLFQFLEAHHLLGSRDLPAARALLDQMRPAVASARPTELANLSLLEAQWRALAGDPVGALHSAKEALQQAEHARLAPIDLARFTSFLANCHVVAGEAAEAEACYARAAQHAHGFDGLLVKEWRQFAQAYQLERTGQRAAARTVLQAAFSAHRARQATTLFDTCPPLAAALAAQALLASIEVAHVQNLIVRQQLRAPHRLIANWPWPVAVRTLGKFEISLHGQPVTWQGKAQQRPLALLKVLLAAGETGKPQQAIAGHLWPDVDDPKSALSVTVHRLRKLLGNDAAVLVHAGRIVLNPTEVWSDLDAMLPLCDRIDGLEAGVPQSELAELAIGLLELYRGQFCDGDEDSWLAAARDRSRNRFLAAVGHLGQRLEATAQWGTAHQLYLQAMQAEPLAEATYRGLMRCAHAQHDPAAAFSLYRRCRDTLSIVLGRKPSEDTERLAVELGLRS